MLRRFTAPLVALALVGALLVPPPFFVGDAEAAITRVSGSLDQAITASYLGTGNEIEIIGPGHLEFWVESTTVDWTYKYQVNGGDWIEETITAGTAHMYFQMRRGTKILLDVKMASGTSILKVQRT